MTNYEKLINFINSNEVLKNPDFEIQIHEFQNVFESKLDISDLENIKTFPRTIFVAKILRNLGYSNFIKDGKRYYKGIKLND